MYMIDFYLLGSVVSFCNHTKTAASLSEVSCALWALADQVTQQHK